MGCKKCEEVKEALLDAEAKLHTTAYNHWDMSSCPCDICQARRIISKVICNSEALYKVPLRKALED